MKIVNIHYQDGRPLTDNTYIAEYGFRRMGYDVRPFTSETIKTLQTIDPNEYPISKNQIWVGGINSLHKIIKLTGVSTPVIHNPHDYLPHVCGSRNIDDKLTLGDVRTMFNNNEYQTPMFIKPKVDDKAFTGFVVKSALDLMRVLSLSDELKLLNSEVINIKSEYRCFVLDGNLVGCKNYTGDFKVLPDFNVVETAIHSYDDQPVAYTLDFAITGEGETVLIEINDAFGLSAYGLNPITYCKMLQYRWEEIMRG